MKWEKTPTLKDSGVLHYGVHLFSGEYGPHSFRVVNSRGGLVVRIEGVGEAKCTLRDLVDEAYQELTRKEMCWLCSGHTTDPTNTRATMRYYDHELQKIRFVCARHGKYIHDTKGPIVEPIPSQDYTEKRMSK